MSETPGSAAPDEPEVFTIERGPSIYMDGTGDFYIRRPDKPGVLATVVLPLDWKDKGR